MNMRVCALISILIAAPACAQTVIINQGEDWTSTERNRFYSQDQGSRIMPLAWMQALKTKSGLPFLADELTRYGYLQNPASPTPGIPVGFTVAAENGKPNIGMTCAACHTRQIEVDGTPFRIDGGPAIVDFQAFLQDLDDAVIAVLASDTAFDEFAAQVLNDPESAPEKETLKIDVETWSLRFHTLVTRALPDPSWGPGRLDAVSMIFNRLTGLDLGEPPTYLIPDNIHVADAPTRYPFLWNAARQDKTQWPGFASNGNDILGLARNLGEVMGVFGIFHPKKQSGFLKLNVDYLSENSANFKGLGRLEDAIWKIGTPQWVWELDAELAATGQAIFARDSENGGCIECHGIRKGAFRSISHTTWKTPIQNVGTDTRECNILKRTANSGVLTGAKIPIIGNELKETDTAFNILAMSVLGSIVQQAVSFSDGGAESTEGATEIVIPAELEQLREAFPTQEDFMGFESGAGCAYESRVMEGIWAAAPYLHNGSVPTLAALLEKPDDRPGAFKIGPNYDLVNIGIATEQTAFDHTLVTTGCDDLDSGNSRCGHDFGTDLSDEEKLALLEYLKDL